MSRGKRKKEKKWISEVLILLENLEIIKVVSGSVILPERLHF